MKRHKTIIHHSTKYDGSLHYRYPVELVSSSERALVVFRGPDVQLESYRGEFTAGFNSLSIFHSGEYYNTTIAWNRDWQPRMHYVNIASPAAWDSKRLTWADLDLDVIRDASTGSLFIDDEDEFESHIERFAYPEKLVDRCRAELHRIHEAMFRRMGIFGDEIFAWRLGRSLPAELLVPGFA